MFDELEDARADCALHAGLRDLPTPETSADFEARILAALTPRPSWRHAVWNGLRPALPTAICALTVMLALLHLAQQSPLGMQKSLVMAREAGQGLPGMEAWGRTSQESALDSMENIDLSSASLSFLSHRLPRIPGKRG